MTEFVNITITSYDREATADAQANGRKEIYFNLSESPPAKWATIFDTEYGPARFRHHRARVSGSYLVLEARVDQLVPGWIEKDREQLERDVAETNTKYNKDALFHAERAAQERCAREKVRNRANDLFSDEG